MYCTTGPDGPDNSELLCICYYNHATSIYSAVYIMCIRKITKSLSAVDIYGYGNTAAESVYYKQTIIKFQSVLRVHSFFLGNLRTLCCCILLRRASSSYSREYLWNYILCTLSVSVYVYVRNIHHAYRERKQFILHIVAVMYIYSKYTLYKNTLSVNTVESVIKLFVLCI